MPYKSKRNRRIPHKRKVVTNPTDNKAASSYQTVAAQSEKVATSYSGLKTTPVGVTSAPSFAKDLKWIGVVTAVIVILLVASYYVFR